MLLFSIQTKALSMGRGNTKVFRYFFEWGKGKFKEKNSN